MGIEPKEAGKVVVKKSNIKITPADIRRLADLAEEAIEKQGLDFVVQHLNIRFAAEHGNMSVSNLNTLFPLVFPKARLREGISPTALAEEYIETNRHFKVDRLFEEAKRLMAENPGISYNEVSRKVGIPYMTLMKRLQDEGVGNLSKGEKGLRVLAGRGIGSDGKTKYNQYISRDTFEKLRLIVERNGNDLAKAKQEWAVIIKNSLRAEHLFKDIFPGYKVDSIGISGCLEQYSAWLDSNPASPKNRSAEERKRIAKSNEENKKRKAELGKKYKLRKRAKEICATFLESRVKLDSEINNKKLFLKIAREILNGGNGVILSEKYRVSQIAIIGVRRKMLNYFSSYKSNPKGWHDRGNFFALLSLTDFYTTFNDSWVSPEYRDHIRYREVGRVVNENKLVIDPLYETVKKVTESSFRPATPLELQRKKFMDAFRTRALHRPK